MKAPIIDPASQLLLRSIGSAGRYTGNLNGTRTFTVPVELFASVMAANGVSNHSELMARLGAKRRRVCLVTNGPTVSCYVLRVNDHLAQLLEQEFPIEGK